MHFNLRVPNTWYRASFVWPDHHITGVTLPGVPFLIAGSNEHIAWGFTAAYTDRSDLVVVPVYSSESPLYTYEGKLVPFETRREKILVKGGAPVDSETRWTVWGPVIGADEKGQPARVALGRARSRGDQFRSPAWKTPPRSTRAWRSCITPASRR